jgi:hypothetical protein
MNVLFEAGKSVASALRGENFSDTSSTRDVPTSASSEKKKAWEEGRLKAQSKLAGQGGPPRKQMQQEEVLAPLDDDEREALHRRLANRGVGSYATARAGKGYVVGYTTGFSARGDPSSSGYLSPTRQRMQAQTARREQEIRTAREREYQARERARKAALHTARLQAAREAAEAERREEARQALAARRQYQQERNRVAKESARRANIPSLGGSIQKAMPPPPTEKQVAKKKRQMRPEWGTGHAGGHRMMAVRAPKQRSPSPTFEEFHAAVQRHDIVRFAPPTAISWAEE